MAITLSAVEPADLPSVAELLTELDAHYGNSGGEPGDPAAKLAHLREVFTGPDPAPHLLVARTEGGRVVGLAAYAMLWPAGGSARSLYLKELYVARDHRRRDLGRALMDRLFELAREAGCTRVEWTADRDNPDAQRFYESLGAWVHPGKLFYRMPT